MIDNGKVTKRGLVVAPALAAVVFATHHSLAPEQPDPALLGELGSIARSDRLAIQDETLLRVEARANTFTASSQSATALAIAPDGSTTVAWQSRRQDDGRHGVFAQRFDATGRRIGTETRLGGARATHRTKPVVAAGDHGAVVAWEAFGLDGDLNGVFTARLDSDPESETAAPTRWVGPQTAPTLAAGADGQWIAAWVGPASATELAPRVWIRRLDRRGQPIGDETPVWDGGPARQGPVTLSSWADGRFVVVWAAQHEDGRPAGLAARRFGADGQPEDAVVSVNSDNDLGSIEPCVATGPDDSFAVAWMDHGGRDYYDVVVRRFDASSHPTGDAVTVSQAAGREQSGAAVAISPEGRLCVAWNVRSADGDTAEGDFDVMARLFDAHGDDLGPAFRATQAATGDQALLTASSQSCLAFGPQGQLAIGWHGASEMGDQTASHLTLLLPVEDGPAGDLDGNQVVDGRDLRTLYDVLGSRDRSPLHYAAADVNRDGRVDRDDLEAFPATGADLEPLRVAGMAQLRARDEALRGATLWLAEQKVEDEAVSDLPTMAIEAAVPHDPPVRDDRSVSGLPNGGDPFPVGEVAAGEFGFIGVTNTGWTPPDPHMAAGPGHVITMTNGAIAFLDKAGTKTFEQEIEGGNGFWGSLGATGFVFDPEAIYDPHSDRFMAMASERTNSGGTGLSFFLLAVSDDSDPNGTWFKYRIDVTGPGRGGDIDSPNLAVDGQAVYLTADFFSGGQKYLITMLDKAPLLAGQPIGTQQNLLVQGSQSFGIPVMYGAAPAMYMIEHFESSNNNRVRLHALTSPLNNPQRVTFNLTVPSYSPPGSLPQMGSSSRQATFDSRFWSCVWRNGSLWAAHHHSNPVTARWYEIKTNGWPTSGQNPSLAQSGDNSSGPSVHTAFNSISVDDHGNALTTYAQGSTSQFLSMERAFRLAGDASGRMRRGVNIKTSSGPYFSGRWGDYSQASPDPVDPCTIWFTHEYTPVNGSWNTWISRTQMCSLSADVTEMSEANGGTANFTLFNGAGAGNAYVILATVSGTEPGFTLNNVRVPINQDAFTQLVLGSVNNAFFPNFLGTLDAEGRANATFTTPALPGGNGLTMNFAFVEFGMGWEFASNPVRIRIVP